MRVALGRTGRFVATPWFARGTIGAPIIRALAIAHFQALWGLGVCDFFELFFGEGRLHFSVNEGTPKADTVMALPELWAAAYLDDTKVQFALHGLIAEGSAAIDGQSATPLRRTLFSQAPELMLLLPRRRDVRVRRPVQQAPWLHFAHPLLPGSALTLRALDLSTSGCGLWRPATSPPLAPGLVLSAVEVELDDSSIFFADMRVQHATPAGGARAGTRVGCSWIDLSAPAQDTLQRWICGGRHRRRRAMLAL